MRRRVALQHGAAARIPGWCPRQDAQVAESARPLVLVSVLVPNASVVPNASAGVGRAMVASEVPHAALSVLCFALLRVVSLLL